MDLCKLFYDIGAARTPEELREAQRKAFAELDAQCALDDEAVDTATTAGNAPREHTGD